MLTMMRLCETSDSEWCSQRQEPRFRFAGRLVVARERIEDCF